VRCSKEDVTMDIELMELEFEDEVIKTRLEPIFRQTLNEIESKLQIVPPLGHKKIKIILGNEARCSTADLPTNYKIILTKSVLDDQYKAIYQFAHELGHIYCNPCYGSEFIESMCSLLRNYIYINLFFKYGWEKRNCDDFNPNLFLTKKNNTRRDWQEYVAQELQPFFRQHPIAWQLLPLFYANEYNLKDKQINFKYLQNREKLNIEQKTILEDVLKQIKNSFSENEES